MAEFYVKKNRVEYELSNGKKLVDEYNKEKEKDLKVNLDKMEETLNFKDNYKPYDFSFINFSNVYVEEKSDLKNQIISFLKKYENKNKTNMPNQLVLGINKESKYKDKWFIYGDEGKNNAVIDDINIKPYCGRVDYIPSQNKAYLQYVMEKNDEIVKIDFEVKSKSISDEEILNEYLK